MRAFFVNIGSKILWALGVIAVVVIVLLGRRSQKIGRIQSQTINEIVDQSNQKVKEVQRAQINASVSVRGGREHLADRLRGGKF